MNNLTVHFPLENGLRKMLHGKYYFHEKTVHYNLRAARLSWYGQICYRSFLWIMCDKTVNDICAKYEYRMKNRWEKVAAWKINYHDWNKHIQISVG